jgi:hypothetical protein
LDVVKGQVPLILDLKGRLAGAERVVLVNAIAHAVLGYPGPIAVVAFDPLLLDVVSHRLPAMPRGQNGGLPRSLALHLSSATRLAWRRWLSRLAPPHFVSLNVAGLPYLNLEGVRRSGLRAVGWTVRTRQQLQSLTGTLDNFMIVGEAVPPHLHTSNAAPAKPRQGTN